MLHGGAARAVKDLPGSLRVANWCPSPNSCWASRAQPAPKHIVYGATELLSGEAFLAQLSELGRKSGAA